MTLPINSILGFCLIHIKEGICLLSWLSRCCNHDGNNRLHSNSNTTKDQCFLTDFHLQVDSPLSLSNLWIENCCDELENIARVSNVHITQQRFGHECFERGEKAMLHTLWKRNKQLSLSNPRVKKLLWSVWKTLLAFLTCTLPNTDLAASVLKEGGKQCYTPREKEINKDEWKLQKCNNPNKSFR